MAQVVVNGQIRGFDQAGRKNQKILFKVIQTPSPFPLGDSGKAEVVTDANGDFTVSLEEAVTYVAHIEVINLHRTITIPVGTVGPVDIFDFWQTEATNFNFYGDES